jgi:signal transduction histidine kinase/CheY-like chemotaxis protein
MTTPFHAPPQALTALAENAPQPIWCVDVSFTLTWSNLNFRQYLEPEGVHLLPHFMELYAKALKGYAVFSDESFEVKNRLRHFAASLYPLRDADRVNGVAVMLRDTTTQTQLASDVEALRHEVNRAAAGHVRAVIQQQLAVADRLTSIGTLAAGVSHEINNPLAAVLVNLQLAQEDVQALDAIGAAPDIVVHLREELRDAIAACDRVKHIVRDLKTFARNADRENDGPVNVHPVLELSMRMAANHIRHRAKLHRHLEPVPAVLGNEARLGQVFLNLLVNAAQAIPEGNADRNEIKVATRVGQSGQVVVEISDTGCGIPSDNLSRIWDPFFTTKPPGEGTGLGLSISHQIVVELGGDITVKSDVGQGTTFTVTLPATQVVALVRPVRADAGTPRRGRVLSVDDEPMVGTLVRRILSSQHDVEAVTSAADVVERVKAGERWDVILCDVMMPQMTGVELYWQLHAVAPELTQRIIFLTAGAFTTSARTFMEQVENERLEKPFDAQALRTLVNRHVAV